MAQSLSSVYLHAVFATKHREKFLASADLRGELHARLGALSRRMGCEPIAIGGVADHVHLLATLGRTVSIADWIKETKRLSSVFVNERSQPFSWQAGYGVFSVERASLDRVAAYVRDQEAHHRQVCFQDEFRKLMSEHGIEWDERYVWD
jgi:putative transposase